MRVRVSTLDLESSAKALGHVHLHAVVPGISNRLVHCRGGLTDVLGDDVRRLDRMDVSALQDTDLLIEFADEPRNRCLARPRIALEDEVK